MQRLFEQFLCQCRQLVPQGVGKHFAEQQDQRVPLQAYLPPQMGRSSGTYDDWASAWFSCGDTIPCARQVPVGVLAATLPSASTPPSPWLLEVHFTQRWPAAASPFRVPQATWPTVHHVCNARHMFFNTLKEACFICTGAHGLLQV